VGTSTDTGYTAELALVLTKLGYPPGRGDGALFMGIDLLDGDSYTPFTFSYGTRTWWYREYEGQCCPGWGYMDPSLVVAVGDDVTPLPRYALLGAHPNPFRHSTTIDFELPERNAITLDVFDLQGRHVARREIGVMDAGRRSVSFQEPRLRTGLYLYRLRLLDPSRQSVRATLDGKVMFVQ
jgi:hypothetical protein